MVTVISNARVFDGERVLDEQTVVVDRQRIDTIGGGTPAGATVVDACGGTLLPGLIDAHTHTSLDSLRFALAFGVTTELEMQGHWTAQERREVAERDDVADVRSAGLSITPPGGHPSEIVPAQVNSRPGEEEQPFPFTTGPEHAAEAGEGAGPAGRRDGLGHERTSMASVGDRPWAAWSRRASSASSARIVPEMRPPKSTIARSQARRISGSSEVNSRTDAPWAAISRSSA